MPYYYEYNKNDDTHLTENENLKTIPIYLVDNYKNAG